MQQFQTRRNERDVLFLYRADRFHGELRSSHEGEVFWTPRDPLSRHDLVPDFLELLRVFEEDGLNEFFYTRTDGSWKIRLL